MMTVKSGERQINWNLHGADRIAQNVRNLINTYRYETPYHRTMGLPGGLIDRPSNLLIEEARVEVAQMLAVYEPRANVKDVQCSRDADGNVEIEVILA
jgi:phage baseplate assembly protein W